MKKSKCYIVSRPPHQPAGLSGRPQQNRTLPSPKSSKAIQPEALESPGESSKQVGQVIYGNLR